MKLDALEHPKTFDFASRLEITLPTAIGHLELLWAFTGKQATQGNIGKWPDGAIARACHWMGSPEAFVRALEQARFLDADPEHRFTVHDWYQHAPGWVKAKLAKLELSFIITGERSSEPSSDGSSEGSSDSSIENSPEPSTKGSEGKGSEGKSGEKRLKSPRPRKTTKVPIPDDFGLTPERQAYAEKHLPDVDAAKLMAVFRSTSKAKGWQYVDWDQHWQTLVRQWAPDSGHWSSGQYPRLPPGKRSEPPKEEFRAPGLPFVN